MFIYVNWSVGNAILHNYMSNSYIYKLYVHSQCVYINVFHHEHFFNVYIIHTYIHVHVHVCAIVHEFAGVQVT